MPPEEIQPPLGGGAASCRHKGLEFGMAHGRCTSEVFEAREERQRG